MPIQSWEYAAQRALAGDLVAPCILFRMATDPVIRLASIVGDLELPADNIETTEDAVYTGMGELTGIPQLSDLVNGLAERVEFVLSGAAVDGTASELASGEAASIREVEVNLGFFVFGVADLQRLSPVEWLWDGTADILKVNRQPGDDAGAIRSIVLSVGSIFTSRKKPAVSFWTPFDQRRRSNDDAFCDHVPKYNAGTTVTWPI